MVGYPFDFNNSSVAYGVGNPMGAYSSWNSFALAHHYVVYYCCRELGIDWRNAPYVLLGDDIMIKHDELAKKYMDVVHSLGVEFSLQKSHISPHVFEFAKRLFYCGKEVTPFPISAFKTVRNSPSLMLNILVNEEPKGWVNSYGTPRNLSELYRYLSFSSKFCDEKEKMFFIATHLMSALRGELSAGQMIKSIQEQYFPEVNEKFKTSPMFSRLPDAMLDNVKNKVYEGWFMNVLRKSLLESVAPKDDEKPLGLIAERLVMILTGDDRFLPDAFELIQALPVLKIHGQVEETYMALVRGGDEQLHMMLRGD